MLLPEVPDIFTSGEQAVVFENTKPAAYFRCEVWREFAHVYLGVW